MFIRNFLFLVSALLLLADFTDAQMRGKKLAAKRKPAPVANAAMFRTPSGLTYIITKRGTGARPKAGDTVSVHYTGALTDGTKFDSSKDREKPIQFPLGKRRVIEGWDEGIARLRVGDQAVLIVPPALGYGPKGAGDGLIPPDATLIFIVELVAVERLKRAEPSRKTHNP